MRTRSLFLASVVGVALLGFAGSASAYPAMNGTSTTYYGVDPLAPVTINAGCPDWSGYSHKLLVGGGFVAPHDFAIYENRMVGSTWQVSAFNMASDFRDITVASNCLYWNGNPAKPTIVHKTTSMTTIKKNTTKPLAVTTVNCPSNTAVVSGGYLSTSNGDQVPPYIYNGKSGSAWRVTGYNPASVDQKVSSQVNCLSGWSAVIKKKTVYASSSQTQAGMDPEMDYAEAYCGNIANAVTSGGGWNVTQAHSNFPYECQSYGPTDYVCFMDYEGSGGTDNSSLAYAECLVAPQ